MMSLKKLIVERVESIDETKGVCHSISEVLAQPCFDILELYGREHLHSQVQGMGPNEVLDRLSKVCKVKNYNGISLEDISLLESSDVEMALEDLFNNGRIRKFQGVYSIEKTISEVFNYLRNCDK